MFSVKNYMINISGFVQYIVATTQLSSYGNEEPCAVCKQMCVATFQYFLQK